MKLSELNKLMKLCHMFKVSRIRFGDVELTFELPVTSSSSAGITAALQPKLTDPDLDMPEDMLGWSTNLIVAEEPKK